MGQKLSTCEVENSISNITGLALSLGLTYSEFLNMLYDANRIGHSTTDASGKRTVFAVEKDTYSTVFWRNTVRVRCIRIDSATNKVESYRILNLQQFLEVYKMLVAFVNTNPFHSEEEESSSGLQNSDLPNEQLVSNQATVKHTPMSTSLILDRVGAVEEQTSDLEDCCICMDRQPEVMLPCSHAFCLPCILQWKETFSNLCPICREVIDLGEDAWVVPQTPSNTEVEEEMQQALQGLSNRVARFGSNAQDSSSRVTLLVPAKKFSEK